MSEARTAVIGSAAFSGDDLVLPFQTVRSGIIGRVIRLGPLVDTILKRHDYPLSVSEALGEAIALTAMLGTALKFDGNLILQTKTDGPLDFLVVNYETPGKLRAYAGFDKAREDELAAGGRGNQGAAFGRGHLAMTIDPSGDMDRYQGIVALDAEPLADAAFTYFKQSEQLPTFIRLAVARHFVASDVEGEKGAWQWRAGGFIVQHVAPEGGHAAPPDSATDDDAGPDEAQDKLLGEDDDDWNRVRMLAETLEDHELLDPELAPDRLLYRLFHEEGVRVGATRPLVEHCRCSRPRIREMLKRFPAEDLSDMRNDDGKLSVTCEFCTSEYAFDEDELG